MRRRTLALAGLIAASTSIALIVQVSVPITPTPHASSAAVTSIRAAATANATADRISGDHTGTVGGDTGVPSGTTLATWPYGLRTSSIGALPTERRDSMDCIVISDVSLTLRGGESLYVDSPCVMLRRVRVTTTGEPSNTGAMVQQGAQNQLLVIESSEFDGGPLHVRGVQADHADLRVTRSRFTRFGNAGVEMNNRSGTASLEVTDSYFEEVKGWQPAQHVDGVQVGGAQDITIRGNTILIPLYGGRDGDTSYVSNSAIGLWSELGQVTGSVLIEGNVLAGGGRVIYVADDRPTRVFLGPVTISANVFDRRYSALCGIWGPLYPTNVPAQLVWIGNTWEDGLTVTLQQVLAMS